MARLAQRPRAVTPAERDRVRAALRGLAGLGDAPLAVLRDRRDRLTVRAGEGKGGAVVRLDRSPDPSALAREVAAIAAAFDVGVAPRCLSADPGAGVLVTAFVPGDTWTDERLRDPRSLRRLATALRALRAVGGDLPPFDLAAHVETYRGRVARAPNGGDEALRRDLEELVGLSRWHLATRRLAGLGHHDVTAGNVVGDPPVLVDWEYAARSDPAFDVATVTALHALEPAAREAFLAAFPDLDLETFPRVELLVRTLARVWTRLECIEDPGDARAREWADRLGSGP